MSGRLGTGGAAGAGAPEQPATDAASAYVPAPVSFVSPDEDEEFAVKPEYSDGAPGAGSPGSSGWKDSGRTGAADRVFDSGAGRRRPVVFEEDDDLDVPDFLK